MRKINLRAIVAAGFASLILAGAGITASAQADQPTQPVAAQEPVVNEPVASNPDVEPLPAQLTREQKDELATAGYTETYIDVYYSADNGEWVKNSKGEDVLTDAWVTSRTFTNELGDSVVFKDRGFTEKLGSVPSGTFILNGVTLAPRDGNDFWCGFSGLDWTVETLVKDAKDQRDALDDGRITAKATEFGPEENLEVMSDGTGAWCFTSKSKA